jgi:hypothetical protein
MSVNGRFIIILYNFLLCMSVCVLLCTCMFLVRGLPRSGVCPLYRFVDVFSLTFISFWWCVCAAICRTVHVLSEIWDCMCQCMCRSCVSYFYYFYKFDIFFRSI